MANYRFNPLTGSMDLVGSGSGPAPTPTTGYNQSFNSTSSWTLASGKYQIQINESTHLHGVNPVVQVFEFDGTNYNLVDVNDLFVDNSGQVTIKVLNSPDLRFAGKIIIS